MKTFLRVSVLAIVVLFAAAASTPAAQLSTDARTSIPHGVQQLVTIDYHAMENSNSAMSLKERIMPPELKRFEEALHKSGLNTNHDVEQLAFVLFRSKTGSETLDTVGIAQGQFSVHEIIANFRKQKLKPTLVRTNKIYPLAKTDMVVCFVDPSTMVFGDISAVKKALDARDGITSNLLSNGPMMDAMSAVEYEPMWSILDQKGTQIMMRQVIGQAGSTSDYETIRKRLQSSWYAMDFQHGVKFNLTISTSDSFAAATLSSVLSAGLTVRKMSGTGIEKQALSATSIASDGGRMSIHFSTTDAQFIGLLQSPLFQGMVR